MDGDGYKRPHRLRHDAGTEGRGPRGAIGDTNCWSTSGPDPATEDVRIVTQTHNVIPSATLTCATEVLGRVFSDICEIKTQSCYGNTYYITFTNDASRLTHVVFLALKSDALAATKTAFAAMENETGRTIKKFRSDNGSEYTSIEFKEYLKSKGISQEFTNPHTPQENGISERKNRTLNDKVCTSLCEEAVENGVFRFKVCTKNNADTKEPCQS